MMRPTANCQTASIVEHTDLKQITQFINTDKNEEFNKLRIHREQN